MSNRKRGFVFYFDNILAVDSLPPDQRGWLLSALCSYADRVWQDTSVGIEEVLDLYPQMSQQASVACRFLAARYTSRPWPMEAHRVSTVKIFRSGYFSLSSSTARREEL